MLASVVLLAAGCSEGDFGESLLEPRQTAATASAPSVPAGGVHVPAAAPLTVADSSRFSTGDATAESAAQPSGAAHASASLAGIGDGWSEFTLGHVVAAGRAAAQDVGVTFTVDYDYELQAPESNVAAARLTGQVTFKVVVLDSQRRILRRQVIADAIDDDGSVRNAGREQIEFDLTLAPGRAYHFIIAGRTQMTRQVGNSDAGPTDAPASATLRVTSASIDIVPRD
ncbi:MAG: hypothetical protein C4547_03395 [Phycisphaerales bacterium]|nr:MAG: hypothetical protein C4547_03395 [Phycisphaerales bacterium]